MASTEPTYYTTDGVGMPGIRLLIYIAFDQEASLGRKRELLIEIAGKRPFFDEK